MSGASLLSQHLRFHGERPQTWAGKAAMLRLYRKMRQEQPGGREEVELVLFRHIQESPIVS